MEFVGFVLSDDAGSSFAGGRAVADRPGWGVRRLGYGRWMPTIPRSGAFWCVAVEVVNAKKNPLRGGLQKRDASDVSLFP